METVAGVAGPVVADGGLRLVPDRTRDEERPGRMLPSPAMVEPGSALDRALADIAGSYGERTAAFVALQLEYAWVAGDDGRPR